MDGASNSGESYTVNDVQYYTFNGSGTSNNDNWQVVNGSEYLSDDFTITPENEGIPNIEFTTGHDSTGSITYNTSGDFVFELGDGERITMKDVASMMEALKLVGKIFKMIHWKHWKPAVSKDVAQFYRLINELPDFEKKEEKEKSQEHIDKELFEV